MDGMEILNNYLIIMGTFWGSLGVTGWVVALVTIGVVLVVVVISAAMATEVGALALVVGPLIIAPIVGGLVIALGGVFVEAYAGRAYVQEGIHIISSVYWGTVTHIVCLAIITFVAAVVVVPLVWLWKLGDKPPKPEK